jgi:pimeloyl-ACP methyl ester carboxylesterase
MGAPPQPPLRGVRHRQVDVGGVRLHVAEAGRGEPLLLLHGWPQHWWCWRHLIPRLAKSYRVLAVDLRGWGWSDAPDDLYAKSTFCSDILALLDAEGIERTRLMGHDWGGFTAFLLALEHPKRVERMVALDIAPPWLDGPRPRHLALPLAGSYQALVGAPLLGPLLMTSGNSFIRNFIRGGSGPDMQWSDEELDVYASVLREPARARASSACYRTFLTRELAKFALRGYSPESLRVPTLLVMGAASGLKRVLDPQPHRNLRVEEIEGAGHFLPEEAPDEVLALAEPFLVSDGAAARREYAGGSSYSRGTYAR